MIAEIPMDSPGKSATLDWAAIHGRILSDGSPWRPLVHIRDIAHAVICCLQAPRQIIHSQAFNIGNDSQNSQIKQIAQAVKQEHPDCEHTFGPPPNTRSYRVDFSKIPQDGFSCRACGGGGLVDVLDLGNTPLANGLLSEAELSEPEPRFPLKLVFCPDCILLQITETVDPEVLFRNYLYFSSFSDTLLNHAQALAEELIAEKSLDADSLVIEAASNDGYLLQFFKNRGIQVLGVEPASNIAEVAREKGIDTANEFFGAEFARGLEQQGTRADVFAGNNVLAHVADLNGFVAGIATVLKPQGISSIEVPYARDLIERCEFDTIYHEHLCYFSMTALEGLFAKHGLTIFHAQRLPIHGGSLRFWSGKTGHVQRRSSVTELLDEESRLGMRGIEFYRDFAHHVESLKTDLDELIERLCGEGKRVAAYGASAKGSTLLNYFGIGSDKLGFVADRSTVKQGHFTPGTHLPIVAAESLVVEMPDYVLLLTWNFRDEILKQQQEYRDRGGKFIVPVPKVEVV